MASQILWQLLQIPEFDPRKVCFILILCGLLSQQIKGQYSGKDIIFLPCYFLNLSDATFVSSWRESQLTKDETLVTLLLL